MLQVLAQLNLLRGELPSLLRRVQFVDDRPRRRKLKANVTDPSRAPATQCPCQCTQLLIQDPAGVGSRYMGAPRGADDVVESLDDVQ